MDNSDLCFCCASEDPADPDTLEICLEDPDSPDICLRCSSEEPRFKAFHIGGEYERRESPSADPDSPEICFRCSSEGPRSQAFLVGGEYERTRELPSDAGRIMGNIDSRSVMGKTG